MTQAKTNLSNENLLYDLNSPLYNHEENKDSYATRISELEQLRDAQYVAMKLQKFNQNMYYF